MFLSSELRNALNREQKDMLLSRLLDSVYIDIRSGFVHHGRGDPVGSILADRGGLAYIRIGEDPQLPEKEQHKFLNPGLGWFRRIVREVLIEFLCRKVGNESTDLQSLLLDRLTTKLKAGKPVQKGQSLTWADLEPQ